jgi:hypothetical protein
MFANKLEFIVSMIACLIVGFGFGYTHGLDSAPQCPVPTDTALQRDEAASPVWVTPIDPREHSDNEPACPPSWTEVKGAQGTTCRAPLDDWSGESNDQANLKAHDRGCPNAVYIAPGGELQECGP